MGDLSMAETLGVPKDKATEEWLGLQWEKAEKILIDNTEAYQNIFSRWVVEESPVLAMTVKALGQEPALTNIVKFIFTVGFIKGILEKEEQLKLESIIGGDKS